MKESVLGSARTRTQLSWVMQLGVVGSGAVSYSGRAESDRRPSTRVAMLRGKGPKESVLGDSLGGKGRGQGGVGVLWEALD